MTGASRISKVSARQVLDSRGRPTVEADVLLESGIIGRACAPSGASTGRHEALELRDGDANVFAGLGVRTAVANVRNEIAPALLGHDGCEQAALDRRMIDLDGTGNLGRLGANATLAVSMAAARAAAQHRGEPLYRHIAHLSGTADFMTMPMPMTNILSGGAHAGRGMDLQDFLAIPLGARTYSEALDMVCRVRASAAQLMQERGLSILLADEGGLSPGFGQARQALELMVESFERAGLRPGDDVAIALDVAASELYEDGSYALKSEGKRLSGSGMVSFLTELANAFPIISIEDGLDQDDWECWPDLTQRLTHLQIVGDDLFVTQVPRIKMGIERKVGNATLIKLNQNGTLSGTLEAIALCRASGYATVISARSGETSDSFIADLAVGTGGGQIKIGSVRNSERLAKYNQLLRIEEDADLPFERLAPLRGQAAVRV